MVQNRRRLCGGLGGYALFFNFMNLFSINHMVKYCKIDNTVPLSLPEKYPKVVGFVS